MSDVPLLNAGGSKGVVRSAKDPSETERSRRNERGEHFPGPLRSVMVTGAGSGLGMECALFLAERGYRVYGTVLNSTEEDALKEKAGSRRLALKVLQMDVTQQQQIAAAVRTVAAENERIHALVQFAGMGLRGFFEDLTLEEIRAVYEVNVFGAMEVTRAVLPHMRAAHSGRIVITSSAAGRMGAMSISGYASTKFALEGFGECLALEMAPFGIHVSLLEPGLIFTPHFTVNRNRARGATDPGSPYYAWFCQHEKMVDDFLRSNRLTPAGVARVVHKILQAKRPRLRYIVGMKPKLLINLRRYIPGEVFDRIYSYLLRRMITSPVRPGTTLR